MNETKRKELPTISYQTLNRQNLKVFSCWWKKQYGRAIKSFKKTVIERIEVFQDNPFSTESDKTTVF